MGDIFRPLVKIFREADFSLQQAKAAIRGSGFKARDADSRAPHSGDDEIPAGIAFGGKSLPLD